MNESSLNDSKKIRFLTRFKCLLLNIVQNGAGGRGGGIGMVKCVCVGIYGNNHKV